MISAHTCAQTSSSTLSHSVQTKQVLDIIALISLESGQKLAHYEILEPIGKGGMGEVFRAKDGKLGRDVAIKVLPEEFARDAERLARFKREAKVLASLNHPNIAAIYGLERSGDTHYLVLELVPGETLAERIARGPIPVDEAVRIAMKIAEALEEAYEHGIVHRDLKPANVKITPDDEVKVLDFGLAKAFVADHDTPEAAGSMSPTITRDATRAGVIMGTAAYMSPEQAKGKRVGRRADIWAFGAVLYEMLTGRRAFIGEDVSDTLAAVLRAEPDWDLLPAKIDGALGNILRLCLTKDVKLRARDIGDVRLAMDGAFETPRRASEPGAPASRALPWVAAVVASLVTGLAAWSLMRSEPAAPEPTRRFAITLPPEAELSRTGGTFFAISQDGSDLVYIGEGEAGRQLFRRSMHQLDVVPIQDTLQPSRPFFSPDGAWLGFFTVQGLEKISLAGGPAVPICDDPICGRGNRGGAWTLDERIVIGSNEGGLSIVAADGGAPEPLTAAAEGKGHWYPAVLPNGSGVLFTSSSSGAFYRGARMALYDFESEEFRELLDGAFPRFAEGHILFAREDSLWAVPFDQDALELTGDPFFVQEDVARPNTTVQFQVAQNQTLVYMPASAGGPAPIPVWVDRRGRVEPLPGISGGSYRSLRLSPDGTRLALEELQTPTDLWIYDVARGTLSRLTTDPATESSPLWTPDGERVVFGSDRENSRGLYSRQADGTGDAERLTTVDYTRRLRPHSWSSDGTMLLFSTGGSRTTWDIGFLSMAGESSPRFLIQTEMVERHPAVSPDGRWIAYTSELSGEPEVYVERFPDLGDRRLISTDGGTMPLWSPDGRELFYMTPDDAKLMVVSIDSETRFKAGAPEVLFEGNFFRLGGLRSYDVTPDGQRFVILSRDGTDTTKNVAPPSLVVVQNWLAEY